MNHLTFLLSIPIFCGPALLLIWRREQRVLKKYELVILIMVLLSILFVGPADFSAIHLQAWQYGAGVTSGIYLLTLPETYLFGMAVTAIVAMVTLVYTTRIDREKSRAKRRKQYK